MQVRVSLEVKWWLRFHYLGCMSTQRAIIFVRRHPVLFQEATLSSLIHKCFQDSPHQYATLYLLLYFVLSYANLDLLDSLASLILIYFMNYQTFVHAKMVTQLNQGVYYHEWLLNKNIKHLSHLDFGYNFLRCWLHHSGTLSFWTSYTMQDFEPSKEKHFPISFFSPVEVLIFFICSLL